ncbi:MAG: hypothetical protein P4L50_00425 [Anaerolineaceae bacterium]|nr:hypothetical protein [Anaerolineaceae bacterium]
MPRPKRPGWSKITITVSDKVAREIRVLAAGAGIEMGTYVDRTIRDHRLIPTLLDKIFAEDVETTIRTHPDPKEFESEIERAMKKKGLTLDPLPTFPKMKAWSIAWKRAGLIPQPWKSVFFHALVSCNIELEFRIVSQKMLNGLDWFDR